MSTGRIGALACTVVALIALAWFDRPASAQNYPESPIRLVVAFAPGGLNDLVARLIAEQIGSRLGQPVIVENKPGAGGEIGADFVAKSKPDGYTILMGAISNIGMAPGQHPDLRYNPLKDFEPIALVAGSTNVLVVNPNFEAHSVKELIELARQKPGTINFASAGEGSAGHLTAVLFELTAGVKLVHIPYKGDVPAATDVAAGHVQMVFAALPAVLPLIKGGKLRALAVTTKKRSSSLPDVPTVAEAGNLPDFEVSIWVGVLAPAGTPKPIVDLLGKAIEEAVSRPEMRDRFKPLGVDADFRASAQFAEYMRSEILKWTEVSKKAK